MKSSIIPSIAAALFCMVAGHASESAQKKGESIPFDQIGARAQKDYKGDAIGVVKTPEGALLKAGMQKLHARAGKDGLWLDSMEAGAEGSFRLVSSSLGRDGSPSRPLTTAGDVMVKDQLVSYLRKGVIEEYSVSMDGVRQDFLVMEKPAGKGDLVLSLNLSEASAKDAANGVKLILNDSKREIAYSRLKVTDATGKEISATMCAAETQVIQIKLNDTQALYPIRIDPTFSDADWVVMNPEIPGANGAVYSIVFDTAGNMYVGGIFTAIVNTPANYIAKWNGSTWVALGTGMNFYVNALATDSDGNLYAGGEFTTAGGVSANRIAKWNGSTWSALGAGMNERVYALAFDSSGNLYVGGLFTTAGGVSANYIAKWDGSTWSALGAGMNERVYALAIDSSGNLYAGGGFTTAGGVSANNIAKWNGSTWSALGSGVNNSVFALAIDNSWNLYVGGNFTTAGGKFTPYIAKATNLAPETPPSIVVIQPANNSTQNNSIVNANGTASDVNNNLTLVQYRVNGGSWQNATGTSTWTAAITLTYGSNTLDFRAQDSVGSYSSIITRAIAQLNSTTDTDGDGLNDLAEYQMSNLGFDWQVSQPSLVSIWQAGNAAAGYVIQSQMQALQVNTPLISRDPGTGAFKLTLGIEKSTNLSTFTAFPMTSPQTSVNPQGMLEFQFTNPDPAVFFRVQAQ